MLGTSHPICASVDIVEGLADKNDACIRRDLQRQRDSNIVTKDIRTHEEHDPENEPPQHSHQCDAEILQLGSQELINIRRREISPR